MPLNGRPSRIARLPPKLGRLAGANAEAHSTLGRSMFIYQFSESYLAKVAKHTAALNRFGDISAARALAELPSRALLSGKLLDDLHQPRFEVRHLFVPRLPSWRERENDGKDAAYESGHRDQEDIFVIDSYHVGLSLVLFVGLHPGHSFEGGSA